MSVQIKDEVWSEENLEYKLCRSMYSGEFSMAKGVYALLLKQAGDYYAAGRDELASSFRYFAQQFKNNVLDPAGRKFDEYANEATHD